MHNFYIVLLIPVFVLLGNPFWLTLAVLCFQFIISISGCLRSTKNLLSASIQNILLCIVPVLIATVYTVGIFLTPFEQYYFTCWTLLLFCYPHKQKPLSINWLRGVFGTPKHWKIEPFKVTKRHIWVDSIYASIKVKNWWLGSISCTFIRNIFVGKEFIVFIQSGKE